MIMICEEHLVPNIDKILPSLLDIIKKPLMDITDDNHEAKTTQTEDMELALQMISMFMKHYPKSLGGYL